MAHFTMKMAECGLKKLENKLKASTPIASS